MGKNILITGSRNIVDKDAIYHVLNNNLSTGDVIIHGGAKGVDSIAQEYADEHGHCTVIFKSIHPDKGIYYLHRNAEMVGACDWVIAFWDGKSRGTKFTIDYAQARKLSVRIIQL